MLEALPSSSGYSGPRSSLAVFDRFFTVPCTMICPPALSSFPEGGLTTCDRRSMYLVGLADSRALARATVVPPDAVAAVAMASKSISPSSFTWNVAVIGAEVAPAAKVGSVTSGSVGSGWMPPVWTTSRG